MWSYCQQTLMEEVQNFSNWNKAIVDVPVLKRKRFLARKMHKLKKILKLGLRSLAGEHEAFERRQNAENEELERRQNYENEELERRQNYVNEELEPKFGWTKDCQREFRNNWENYERDWCDDQCNCQLEFYEDWTNDDRCYWSDGHSDFCHSRREHNSTCYVFVPGQLEPVPMKQRTTIIPGGVMWISYRPDVDIHPAHNLCSFTSSQIPQGQHSTVV